MDRVFPINSQSVLQPIGNVTNIKGSTFASRLIKHGFDLDMVGRRLAEMTADPARAKLFQELEEDGGETSFKDLLKRLVKLRPIEQAQKNNTVAESGTAPPEATKNASTSVVPDGDKPKQRSQLHSYLRPISSLGSIEQKLIPDDLSLNGEFVRLGGQYPGFLVEGESKRGEAVYRFKNQHRVQAFGVPKERTDHIELSNCFYPITKSGSFDSSPWADNLELAKATGAVMNACGDRGTEYYNGEFDMQINMRFPGNVTVFRLIPHSDGLQYLDSSNKLQKLSIASTVDEYNALLAKGARFETSGDSPLTMRVEHRDGQHFFTVKTRSDYSTYKADGNYCDIPFTGSETPLGMAKCCTDGEYQRQDVKYIYAEPLKNGWFHVRFNVEFSDYSETRDVGTPYTAFGIDNEEGVISHGRIGNNNRDSKSDPLVIMLSLELLMHLRVQWLCG